VSTKYFVPVVDNDWNTSGNWFSDLGATAPDSLPVDNDTVYVCGDVTSGFAGPLVTGLTVFIGHPTTGTTVGSFVGDYLSGTFEAWDSCILSGNPAGTLALHDTCMFSGAFDGNATFYASSNNDGVINGNASFQTQAFNTGVINGNATFALIQYDHTFTPGSSVTGTITVNGPFYISGGNQWGENDSAWLGSRTWQFNNSSYNSGTVTGTVLFKGNAYNGGTAIGTVTFEATGYNSGTVSGTAYFNATSYNNNSVDGNAFFSNSAYNGGSISGDANFSDSTYSAGPIAGDATFTASAAATQIKNGTAAVTGDVFLDIPIGGDIIGAGLL